MADQVKSDAEIADERNEYLNEEHLKGVIQKELDSALGWTGTRLAKSRRENLDYYFGNPRGDERDGRSGVSSRIVFEQVEALLPTLMEIFTSGAEVARFIPRTAEDEEGAQQATDACNYVFQQSNGFMCLYTFFKDALISKNGIVKVFWDTGVEGYHETYEGKTVEEVVLLEQDEDFEFREASAFIDMDGERMEVEDEQLEQLGPEQVEFLRFDIKGIRTPDDGKVRIENVAPENFVVNRDCTGLEDPSCRFAAQRTRATASQLVAWGFDKDIVKTLPTSNSMAATSTDNIIRASQDDGAPLLASNRSDSERTIDVIEAYILIDRDGDGISEWWRCMCAGTYAERLISADPCQGHPFASVTPVPVPHRFYGLGLADVVKDLEVLNTTLWRQYMDSLYLATDPRVIVLSQGQGDSAVPMANLDQLVDATPGGYIEEFAPGAIRNMETQTNAGDMVPAMEMHRTMVSERTGIGPESIGAPSPDSISKHVFGAMVQSSAAAQRLTMYARVFADTGVRRMFQLIYRTLLEHATKEFAIKLRGEWVPVNPGDWATNYDTQVSVGLGHGSRMEKVANLQTIGQVLEKLITGGATSMVTQENIYNTASSLIEALGFKDTSRFITDPATAPPPPPPEPTPAEQAIEAQTEIELMKIEVDRQRVEVDRYKAMVDAKRIELSHEVDIEKLRIEGDRELMEDKPWGIPGPPPPAPPPMPPAPPMPIEPDVDPALAAAIAQEVPGGGA